MSTISWCAFIPFQTRMLSERPLFDCGRAVLSVWLLCTLNRISMADEIPVKSLQRVALTANSITYDIQSQTLFASLPKHAKSQGNSIVSIDPLTGKVGTPIPVGSDPTEMAITHEGKYLYVILRGERAVRRVDLLNKSADLRLSLPGQPESITAVPRYRDRLIVTYHSPPNRAKYASVLENGVLKPNRVVLDSFAISFPNHIFTHETLRLSPPPEEPSKDHLCYHIGAKGFQQLVVEPRRNSYSYRFSIDDFLGTQEMWGDGNGRLYTSLGQVVDPERLDVLGTLFYSTDSNRARSTDSPFTKNYQKPLVDPLMGRIFYLNGDRISVFDYNSFNLLQTLLVPHIHGETRNLIRWGAQGLAFQTKDQIILFQCQGLWEPIPPVDLAVSIQETQARTSAGEPFVVKVGVTNVGARVAHGVFFNFTEAPETTITECVYNRSEEFHRSGNYVQIETLKPQESVELLFRVAPYTKQRFRCFAVARANESDATPENNVVEYEFDNTKLPFEIWETLPSMETSFLHTSYRSLLYLKAAVALQRLGKAEAIAKLKYLAYGSGAVDMHSPIFVLCRMLFTSQKGKEFRPPMLGSPYFFAGTWTDWALSPIALIDGIPFLVQTGTLLGGHPESPAGYLHYCIENCDWNPLRYKLPTKEELKNALDKLLSMPLFRGKLDKRARTILQEQIDE